MESLIRFSEVLTSNRKCRGSLLLSKLVFWLENEPVVNNKPLSSLKINGWDQLELDGGDSISPIQSLYSRLHLEESSASLDQGRLIYIAQPLGRFNYY